MSKNIFVDRCILEVATSSAIAHYNEGAFALKSLFEKVNIPGRCFMQYCTSSDKKRVSEINMKSTVKVFKQRKTNGDKIVERKGETYVPGGF